MQDAFRSSPLTVYEMRGSVKRTMFVRAWVCLPTCACVLPCLLRLHSCLPLSSVPAYLAGLSHTLDSYFSALYHTLISS